MNIKTPTDVDQQIKQSIAKMPITQTPEEFIIDAIRSRLKQLQKSNYKLF